VAMGPSGSIGFFVSTDGMSWSRESSPVTYQLTALGFAGGHFIATALNGTVLTSPDGIAWTVHSLSTSGHFWGVAGSADQVIMVGENGAILSTFLQGAPAPPLLGPITIALDHSARIGVTGLSGQRYDLEVSTNFLNWTELTNVTLTSPSGVFVDPSAGKFRSRFYRAIASP